MKYLKYKRLLGVLICVSCTSLFIQNGTDATTVSSSIGQRTAGAAEALDVKDSLDVILKDAGAAKVLEDKQEETLWGYDNLGIANVEGNLNIRATAAEDGKIVGKLSGDGACEIIDFKDSWAHVKSGKVEGYVAKEYLLMGQQAKKRAKEIVKKMAIVTTDTLKVRGEPNTDSEVITLVPNGEELEVVEKLEEREELQNIQEVDGWDAIMLDDEVAYVSNEYVKIEEKLDTAVTLTELLYGSGVSDVKVDLVKYAQQFVGNPYVWGGTSLTKGADCSGFVLSIFKKYGVSLPHSSRAQANCGTKVDALNAQPGDLFFYSKGGSINHVAIYIGNGQVVHASNPKTGIRISNAFYRTPATVRRIISN
ncbi:MAG: NlpC/P60 family protein [Lachnospiraceae bacterium]|nr:NlpC/P60 family protein [Lachnospiraceae bacterium]